MVLTNQLIYLVNVKTMRKIFFQIMYASQKVHTLLETTSLKDGPYVFPTWHHRGGFIQARLSLLNAHPSTDKASWTFICTRMFRTE